MPTTWAEIVTDHALVEINDERLNRELGENPALFFRKMALYMKNAIPRFNRPPEERAWLSCVEPLYDDFLFQADGSAVVNTGKTGFALCCCVTLGTDKFGNPTADRFGRFSYDSVTGAVTFTEPPPTEGTFSFDFYTDGVFERTLAGAEKRILGLCVQMVWENRFSGEWLNRVPKVKDKSFDMGSEANHTRANTERLRLLNAALNGEMARYAQNLAYRNVVSSSRRLRKPE